MHELGISTPVCCILVTASKLVGSKRVIWIKLKSHFLPNYLYTWYYNKVDYMQPYRTILVSCRYSTFYLFLCDTYFVYFGLALYSMLTLQFDSECALATSAVDISLLSFASINSNSFKLFRPCTVCNNASFCKIYLLFFHPSWLHTHHSIVLQCF